MNGKEILWRRMAIFALMGIAQVVFCGAAAAQAIPTNDPPKYGPYNGHFLAGGDGLSADMVPNDTVLLADTPWTMWCWVKTSEAVTAPTLVAGVGETTEEYPRYLAIDAGKVSLWMGEENELSGEATVSPNAWHFLAAEFDGKNFHVFSDGREIAAGPLTLGSVSPLLQMAPMPSPLPKGAHFAGHIAGLTLTRTALTAAEIQALAQDPPDFARILYDEGSKPWPVQTHGQAGYRAPQDPSLMPVSRAPFSKPVAEPVDKNAPALEQIAESEWEISGGWKLEAAPEVSGDGAAIAEPRFDTAKWMAAVVPGTVLTTMVDRGIYPDPSYGLNNLAIPESLNKQSYWYRVEVKTPEGAAGKHLTLTFEGINYKAEVWLNGARLGEVKGAFIRGVFDVSKEWKAGKGDVNVLAVEVSPPPHPGIPNEQSLKGGPGENGGIMCLDGPTFVASEGWDWIPGVRDRETGIWQPVELKATGGEKIGDVQVITRLPLPETSRAEVTIRVPVENLLDTRVQGTLKASFETVELKKEVTLAPGENSIALTPAEFKQLTVEHPRLWWPNGYGKPELYHLHVSLSTASGESDRKEVTFGIREITYELSLLDSDGELRRVEVDPTRGAEGLEGIVDETHEGIRQIPPADPPPAWLPKDAAKNWRSWVASLEPGAEKSPAVRGVQNDEGAPYLAIKVNGVKIACRGGSWGMDDFMKRVSRKRLEPYFRLHRNANVNIIRNWVGQNTEEVFYELADEYGMLVWNDFWETTQNYNLEPEDPALLLRNVKDAILRYRNHPSIAVWCGRNEGVPQPVVNQGMAELVNTLDGTRYYSPSSNEVNLQGSGPYKYMNPKLYFTTLNHGFSVETGTPSMSTAEAFRSSMPAADVWPISDDWAYHDWHQSGGGDMAPFMAEMQTEFGAAANFMDFERKAQMLDYVSYRAIFEGMNAHLWAPNSGRMLWMTQPAWPSNTWQIFTHDYDTQSSYYGTKTGCEPVHIQLDIAKDIVEVVNTTRAPLTQAVASARVYSLDNKLLAQHEERIDVAADAMQTGFPLDLADAFHSGVVLVKLELHDAGGKTLSQNLYWLGADSESYRALTRMPTADLSATAKLEGDGTMDDVRVTLANRGSVAALQAKLTLENASDGSRILPAYYSDNYISLLPGESREIEIEYPAGAAKSEPMLGLRGWNLVARTLNVARAK